MKKFLPILLLLLYSAADAQTLNKFVVQCSQGGNVVATSGVTSLTKHPKSFPSSAVTVYAAGTTTPLSIYDDSGGITPKANPTTCTSTDATLTFYASAAYLDIRLAPSGVTPFTVTWGTVNPVAGNDSRLPTQGEKDALPGSYGTPSSSNKYVTVTDPILAMLGSDSASSFSNGWTPPVPAVATYTRYAGNPVLTAGGSGFDAGGVRDCALLPVNGTYYMYYTGNSQTSTPWNPTIGLATSTNGYTWTKQGQVLAAGAGGSYDAGGIFSPGVFYENGVFYLFGSVITNPAHWYTGPISIALYTSTDGLHFTAQGVKLTRDQAWEAGQGVYAPDVKRINGTYVMYYSSATGTGSPPWRIGTATATTLTGAWTKNANNPIMGTSLLATEEPAVVRLPSGASMAFVDQVTSAPGVGVYYTLTEGAQSGWAKLRNILDLGIQSWENAVIGSSSVCLMPNGRYLIAYNARGTAVPDDNPRSIGVATLDFLGQGTTEHAEGIFTPTLAINGVCAGCTYTTQVGQFTLDNKKITVEFRVVLSSKGSSVGGLTLKGLPVPPTLGVGRQFFIYGYITSATYTGQAAIVINGSASATDAFVFAVSNGTATQMTDASIGNTSDFSFVGSYWID